MGDLQDGDELSDIEIKEKDVSSIVPLKTEFSASNSVTVKLEPLSMNSLLEMECDEEDCGRFFVTLESMLDHKRYFHKGLKRKRNKLDNVEDSNQDLVKKIPKKKYERVVDPIDGIEKLKCHECEALFKSRCGIPYHRKQMHSNDENMQKCILCPILYPSNKLVAHMRRYHRKDDKSYKCDWCSKVFKTGCQPFLFHLAKEHKIGEFRHTCDQCDKVFPDKRELERHKETRHTKSLSVICEKCGKECLTQRNLDKHMERVHLMYKIKKEDTIKKCDKCDIEFEKPEEFNDHLKKCLDKLKDFTCKLCDSRWVSHLSLWQHFAVDHKILRYVCDKCGYASTTSVNLRSHKNHVHDKIYKYVCHICAQPKQTKLLLEEHMTISHGQGERKFQCDKCDKSFVRSFDLKHHFESHHAKKTLYQCEQCPKTFWMKSYLNTHVRMMHENYRPHKCDICQQGFVYKRDVVKHKKQIHNIHE